MLSIIIPTLNEENCLFFLLKNLKRQTFKDYEIIVADAGSDDKTIRIAKDFDCRITKGGLPAQGRNEGAKIAGGELFLFLDADNKILSEDFLEKLIKEFKRKELVAASFPIYPEGNELDKLFYFFYNLWVKLIQSIVPHATNSILATRQVHQKIGGFDEEIKIGEDHDYVRRAKKFGKFGFINIEPIFTSCRRFEKDGRLLTYSKYILSGIYMLLLGPIRTDIFKYRFEKSLKDRKT